jgi:hypothetical protein
MRDEVYLQQKLTPILGDVRQPKYEARRAALDIAIDRVKRNVVHHSAPTGNAGEHGAPDTYPGLIPFGSNKHLNAIIIEVAKLEKESLPALKTLAQQRGYYGAHPPSDQRFEYVEGYREQMMESFDANGEKVTAPVYGRGSAQRSKYMDLPSGNYEEIIYGNPKTNRGSDQRSRFADVPHAPTLPDGSIDYDELNRRNGHRPMSGRRNVTGKIT